MLSAFWLSFSFSSSFEKAGERMAKKGDYALLQPPSFGFHFSPVERTRTSFRKLYSPIATPIATPITTPFWFFLSPWKSPRAFFRELEGVEVPEKAVVYSTGRHLLFGSAFPWKKKKGQRWRKRRELHALVATFFWLSSFPWKKNTSTLPHARRGRSPPPPGLG